MLSMGSASEPHAGERQMAVCVCVVTVLSPAPPSGYALLFSTFLPTLVLSFSGREGMVLAF